MVAEQYDAVVIGGGFYGAVVAHYLRTQRADFRRVAVIEREADLMLRASLNNQARVHNGYHYPRSLVTAQRSRVNLPRFVAEYRSAVRSEFTKLYALARRGSYVTKLQFERFCDTIGARIEPAAPEHVALFDERLVAGVFAVEEFAFDAVTLRNLVRQQLVACDVELRFHTRAKALRRDGRAIRVDCQPGSALLARYVFNCTYAGINQLGGEFEGTRTQIKQEATELALVRPPAELERVGITLMDGPFFSCMPYPPCGLHTLSHVRYTPHFAWADRSGEDPYEVLRSRHAGTRHDRMVRDVARYVPALAKVQYQTSVYEVKTLLVKNEGDDGRPILFERSSQLPGCYTILGGKLDNVYDILERLDREDLGPVRSAGALRAEAP